MTLEQFQFEYNGLVMGGINNPYVITVTVDFVDCPTIQNDIPYAKQDG